MKLLLLYVLVFVAVLPSIFIYQAFLRNAIHDNTTLEGGHGFHSNVAPHHLLWLALSNAVVVVLSLDLMLPWAKVRMARYMANHTQVLANGSVRRRRDRQGLGHRRRLCRYRRYRPWACHLSRRGGWTAAPIPRAARTVLRRS